MRLRSYLIVLGSVVCLLLALALSAQDQEQPSPWTFGGFETQGSVTAGYRFTDFKGRQEKFLELFDLQKGFRLMDFNLLGRAPEGASLFADSYTLDLSGLGGDPYPGGQLTVRKNKLYDLRVNYRQSYYYWDRNDNALVPTGLHGLTSNHNWATVRRYGSANLSIYATNNLRFNFEYGRTSRDGVNFTTRALDYFGSPDSWGSFARANPYYVEAPLNDVSNRFTGGVSYTWRDWNFHYRLGYQTFEQNLSWQNVASPERSLNVDAGATLREEVNHASWSEFRRLKTPSSEFSYSGKVNRRLDVRGGYILYRYRGPATLDAAFEGNARTNSAGTTFAPYTVAWDSRAQVTEPTHVLDEGFTLKVKDWWNLHADYRYSRFTVDSRATFHSLRDATTPSDGELENQWRLGMHLLDVNMEFLPRRTLIVRPGLRYLKRDVEVLEDGEIDDVRTRRLKTVWPTLSVFYQPTRIFSVRGDFQSITSGASYTRISPHTDVGSRFVFRARPTKRISLEDNLILRNRKFQDTDFQSHVRSNAFTVSYALDDRLAVYGGFAYDSFFATASVTFIRGTLPLTATWRDQTVNRVWQAGVATQPRRHLGFNLSGNFVRTTGVGEISGEPPAFGPMTWPLVTGTVYYDFPKAGRLSLDLQRTYYVEEIVRGDDFRANLLTIRWTKDF
jgi:opacity protein-like surface antigen